MPLDGSNIDPVREVASIMLGEPARAPRPAQVAAVPVPHAEYVTSSPRRRSRPCGRAVPQDRRSTSLPAGASCGDAGGGRRVAS